MIFYLISLWLPSMCQTELEPATAYVRRRMVIAALRAMPPSSTRIMLSRTRHLCTLMSCENSLAFTAFGPIR